MRDAMEESFGTTTAVMKELVSQAREAAGAGASRRSFFAKTASLAGATALGAAGIGFLQPIAASAATATEETTADTVKLILDIAATAESLATTFYFNALGSGSLPDVNSDANRNYFQAAAVQEFEHLMILDRLGGAPLATEFYYPTNMFSDESVFFPTAGVLEDYFISAYIAAAREFCGAVSKGIPMANPDAIGLAVQIGGIECEHRALLNVAANVNPPNNRIIESALVGRVSDAVAPLTPFLQGGSGFSGPYKMPTKGEVNAIAWPYGFASFPKFKIF
jgi:Ferritin-like domain